MRIRLRRPGGSARATGPGSTASPSAPGAAAWLGVTGLGASALLRLSFTSREGSRHFYLLTAGLAGTLTAGALGAGPVRWYGGDWRGRPAAATRDVAVVPALVGAATFAGFYGAARVVRHNPFLRREIASIFRYADEGSPPLVLLIAAGGGLAEELFYRGALWHGPRPLRSSTLAYATSTAAVGNPALVAAGAVTSVVFGWQRAASGGVLAPAVAHMTWSALMLRHIPSLFRDAD